MKHSAMQKNLRRSITRSVGRYIALAVIIALGSGMFVGLRSTRTDMVETAQVYTDSQNMFDLRLMTPYGWGKPQLEDISKLDGVEDAEGLFYTDLIVSQKNDDEEAVFRFYTIPSKINRVVLLGGRMPQAANECLADGFRNDESCLGRTFSISENNDEDTLELMTVREFVIVGYISTPLYMDMNRGSTSVGSGNLTNYYFVPEEAFDTDYFTEIHVTIPGEYKIYSEAYNDALESAAERMKVQLEPYAQQRFESVVEDAEEAYAEGLAEYEDGMQDYHDGKQEAEVELEKARNEIADAEEELADAEQKLIDGEEKLREAKIATNNGWETYEENKKKLESARVQAETEFTVAEKELREKKETVSAGITEAQAGIQQLSGALSELNSGIAPMEAPVLELDQAITSLENSVSELNTSIAAANSSMEEAIENGEDSSVVSGYQETISGLNAQKAVLEGQLADLRQQKAALTAQLEPYYTQRSQLEQQLGQAMAAKALLDSAMTEIENGETLLAEKKASAEVKFKAAEQELSEGKNDLMHAEQQIVLKAQEIADGWIELEEGKEELAQARIDLAEAEQETAEELAKAESELEDAAEELRQAREDIDALEPGKAIVLDRNSNIGYTSLDSSSQIVAGVSKIFPAFFLSVAALVCITTMTRMIDEERTQIGTLKALGYSNLEIISKYLIYAGSSALLGCGLGVLFGSAAFPVILWEAYKIMIFITPHIVLRYNWTLCTVVVISYTALMLLVTWYCCRRELIEVPAELIRPRPPAAGRQLIIERFSFWNRISFLNKVMLRNIFQYRQRLAMMLLGIGGCTALLLTGFGFLDTIVNIVDIQYEEVTVYDATVIFRDSMSEAEQQAFREDLTPYTEKIMFAYQGSAEIEANNKTKDLYMIAATNEICDFIDFHSGSRTLQMPQKDEVLLSVGIAQAMGIRQGDRIVLRNADMESLDLTVSAVYDNHVYNYAIISPETMREQWNREPDTQMAFLITGEGQDPYAAGAAAASDDNVMNVTISEEIANMVRNMMDALNLVVAVIVVCAGLLAAVVLYNLTNINLNERLREIATIKVLGFNAYETAMYVFRENLVLSVMGCLLGLPLGKLLLKFVIDQIKIDMVWFSARAYLPSYLWSIFLTILIAVVVDIVFYFRLDKINMAEALKSVE